MNYNEENQRDKITKKFQQFCKVNLTEFDIYVRRYSNFYDYIIIHDKGNLIVKYFNEDDTLIIDAMKSNTGFFLKKDTFSDFNLVDVYKIADSFSKDYNLEGCIQQINVQKLSIHNILNGVPSLSFKFKFNVNTKENIVNILYNNGKVKINYNENYNLNSILTKYVNRKFNGFYDLFEFTIFQTYFKKKYNLSKFTKKNLKLIQLSRY